MARRRAGGATGAVSGGGSVAVLRALPGVGDLLCAVPALRAVRAAHPTAHVGLAGVAAARWFVERFDHLVDDLLVVEGVTGLPEVAAESDAAARFAQAARRMHVDVAFQLHGDGTTSNRIAALLGAPYVVSAHRPGGFVPPGVSIPYPDDVPEIHRLLAVAAAGGCPSLGDRLELPLTDAERAAAGAIAPGQPIACLHPGAARANNRWPAPRYAALGDHLAARGLTVVLTGTVAERSLTAAVSAAMRAPAVDLAGRTAVGPLAALFERARLVVSNDTGAAHVAAAVCAPSVVVYPASADVDRWAPLDAGRHRRVTPDPGAGWPSVAAVVVAADRQLEIGAEP
jgi:ADP-heptose:LPS heptosyltransferase